MARPVFAWTNAKVLPMKTEKLNSKVTRTTKFTVADVILNPLIDVAILNGALGTTIFSSGMKLGQLTIKEVNTYYYN